MSVKEKPLFKAAEKLGPLPGFLFNSPFSAGFFAIFMCAVFGGFAASFVTAGHGSASPAGLFVAGIGGAGFALVIGVIVLFVIAVTGAGDNDGDGDRRQFVIGGMVAFTLVVGSLAVFGVPLHRWLEKQPLIVYTN